MSLNVKEIGVFTSNNYKPKKSAVNHNVDDRNCIKCFRIV